MPNKKFHKTGLIEFFRTPDEQEKVDMQNKMNELENTNKVLLERLEALEKALKKSK